MTEQNESSAAGSGVFLAVPYCRGGDMVVARGGEAVGVKRWTRSS
jgi:hypothetical protein